MARGQFSFDAINNAIASGRLVLEPDAASFIQACSQRHDDGDDQAFGDLMQYASDHPNTARLVVPFIADEGLRYVEGELRRLRELKVERGLTGDEKRYAKETLQPLFASVAQFAGQVGVPKSNA